MAQITENNQAQHTLTRWTQSAGAEPKIIGKSRVTLNLFDKEDKIETLDANGKTISTREFSYDGLGNCVEQVDNMGEITRFVYDPFSRLQTTVLPDDTEIHRAYASHSTQELPVSLEVVADQKTQLIGTQTFDGLDRKKTVKVGPRFQEYFYEGGQTQVSNMLTAGKNILTYTYEPGLVDTPTIITAGGEESRFDYDRRSAQLTSSTNVAGLHEFAYNNNGQVLSERWTEQGTSKQWETQYTQSLNGRPLTRVQINGLDCTYTYDDKARIEGVEQGDILTTIGYDELGQVCTVSAQNKANQQTLLTELTYDDQGRETIRKMTLGAGHPTQTITQAYRADSKLQSRHLQLNDQTELLETFTYDKRGRMVQYNCEGTNLPKDRYGNAICEQVFGFDALDNVTAVYTTFADGSYDDAESTFAANDPCQLVSITHSHPAYPPVCNLDYDADGNLLHDENGQSLHYDTQGRLLSVNDADGNLVSQYRYDAHNHLLGVTRGTQTETLRFYEDDRLCRTEQGTTKTHYLYFNDQPLGQQEQGSSEHTLLLLSDSKNSVMAESGQNQLRKAIYGAYGERCPDDDLQCLLGFNGEVRDEQSGWYLLGLGYRAYNPTLMRFHSPDSLSPFGAGGVNPYVYCGGDPINYVDPTGHANRKTNTMGLLGGILSAIGIALSVAAVVIAPPVGIAAITSTFVFTGVGIGLGTYGIYEGVMATQATQLRKRESHATSSLISGGLDVVFAAFGIFSVIKTAAKLKAKAAAKTGYLTAIERSAKNISNMMGGTTKVGRNSRGGAVKTSEDVARSITGASPPTSVSLIPPAPTLPRNSVPHIETLQPTVAAPSKPTSNLKFTFKEFQAQQNSKVATTFDGETRSVTQIVTDGEFPARSVGEIRTNLGYRIPMQLAAGQ